MLSTTQHITKNIKAAQTQINKSEKITTEFQSPLLFSPLFRHAMMPVGNSKMNCFICEQRQKTNHSDCAFRPMHILSPTTVVMDIPLKMGLSIAPEKFNFFRCVFNGNCLVLGFNTVLMCSTSTASQLNTDKSWCIHNPTALQY